MYIITNQKQFTDDIKSLSIDVCKGTKIIITKNLIKVSEYGKKRGFHGEEFYKDVKVVNLNFNLIFSFPFLFILFI